MSSTRAYLDWNAGAPLRAEARAAMLAALDVDRAHLTVLNRCRLRDRGQRLAGRIRHEMHMEEAR